MNAYRRNPLFFLSLLALQAMLVFGCSESGPDKGMVKDMAVQSALDRVNPMIKEKFTADFRIAKTHTQKGYDGRTMLVYETEVDLRDKVDKTIAVTIKRSFGFVKAGKEWQVLVLN